MLYPLFRMTLALLFALVQEILAKKNNPDGWQRVETGSKREKRTRVRLLPQVFDFTACADEKGMGG